MTNFKQLLLAATALTLMTGAAMAGENKTFIDQAGTSNEAKIQQGGVGKNLAGGPASEAMRQDGERNSLSIIQSNVSLGNATYGQAFAGDKMNRVGVGAKDASKGVDQKGIKNKLTVEQTGPSHDVFQLQQIGDRNNLTVTQSTGRNNVVSAVNQNGDDNSADVKQTGSINYFARNYVYANPKLNENLTGLNQDGSHNSADVLQKGGNNKIGAVNQSSDNNSANVKQDGNLNEIDTVQQTSLLGRGNTAILSLTGDRNGVANLHGVAAVADVASRSVVQKGQANKFELIVQGNDNSFGANQIGNENKVGRLVITGSFDALGINQAGNYNEIALGEISGSSNEVGVNQLGDRNISTLNIIDGGSNGNALSVKQDGGNDLVASIKGSLNDINVDQYTRSTRNKANVAVVGDNNGLNLSQKDGSTADIRITGDDNNRGSFNSFFASNQSLLAGQVVQVGLGNDVDLTVNGDRNLFAANQTGKSNTVDGVVTGDGNQAMVIQNGTGNGTTFTQTGSMNFVSVTQ